MFENTVFSGNFAIKNTNGFQLVQSEVTMKRCKVDNTRNIHLFPAMYKSSIQYGFIMMRFQSSATILDTQFTGLSGVEAAIMYFDIESKVMIDKTHFIGCISG